MRYDQPPMTAPQALCAAPGDYNQLMHPHHGRQTKKNKQSILDNTSHYIEMLRGDLVIAQQKAERAEKQAEAFRTQTHRGKGAVDKATVMFNTAFVSIRALGARAEKKKTLRPYICADQEKLDAIMTKLRETKQSVSALVKASATGKDEVAVNLMQRS
ncbi:hypothetical protein GQ600_14526 [Phytophthora cactorum]|nr:hypothetical protein GQ600_14526 [Phytophthora cactorum]